MRTSSACFTVALIISGAMLVAAPDAALAQRTWIRHGPGPATLGQVEGIVDRPVTGAVHAVAPHPTSADIVFIGAVNGGIWRTNNATAASPNWTPQLALDQARSIGAIGFDPTDATSQTLLAGAGQFSQFGRGAERVGVWRTTNGGGTWNLLTGGGTIVGLNVSGVAPRGTTLVISANNSDFPSRGVWRSTDTGASWTRISGAAGSGLPAGESRALAGDPATNSRLFTTVTAVTVPNAGVFRSDNTGLTWTRVSTPAMDVLLSGANNTRISVGVSNNVYVAIASSTLTGLFRSGDGGTTWAALDLPQTTEGATVVGIHPGGQANINLSLAADRTNANVVYIGGDRQPGPLPNSIGANDYSGRLFRVDASLAAGAQASHITHGNTAGGSSPHADSRGMAIDANNDLIEVDDGGVYRRTTPLTNTGDWLSINGDLTVTEFHSVAWDPVSKMVIGGAQDTGTPEQSLSGNLRWRSVSTGDGGPIAVDEIGTPGSSERYSSSQNFGGFRRRTINAGGTQTAQVLPPRTVVGGGAPLGTQFYTQIATNNVAGNRLIIGGSNSVYESLDQGNTITEIGVGIVTRGDAIAYGATGNPDMLYIGSGAGVFVRNAAPPAVLTQSVAYAGGPVGDLVLNNANGQEAFVTDGFQVFHTTNAGGAWTDVTGDLAAQNPGTVLSIAFSSSNVDGSVIVGSDKGAFIARGPAFNTWTPVANGLPRGIVFDLDYDPADEILVAGVLGLGAWSVTLDERDPVDVALTLDLSGSMLSPACSTCAAKLQVLKDAVEIFVRLWSVVGGPDDRFGVNYFRSNISELLIGGNALFPAVANAAAIIADVQAQTTVPTNLTAMGGGIQQALNRLTDATRPRHVIAFTDGMQNRNPMVNTSNFLVENQSGVGNSNISPTTPPTDLNTALGIKVNTIGVGATPAFVDLLDDIASETGGLFKLTTAPDDDLRRFYVEELVDALKQFSPQLVDYRHGRLQGDVTTETFTTSGAARRVVFKVSWKRGNAPMRFSVDKDGVNVTQIGRVVSGPFYQIWSVDVPTGILNRTGIAPLRDTVLPAGTWRLRISGPGAAPYEAAAIVDEAEFEYTLAIGGTRHAAGAPIPLTVTVSLGEAPITNARVSARVLAPMQAVSTLLSRLKTPAEPAGFQYEAGATAAQRKYQLLLGQESFQAAIRPNPFPIAFQNNGNGTYSATYANTNIAGPYTIVFRIEGERSDIGRFDRTDSRSLTVSFGNPVLSASGLFATRSGDNRYDLIVRPVDDRGNYLGPDYGHAISVTVNGAVVNQTPVDRLDGSYVYIVNLTQPPSATNIGVSVMGRPLFTGPLSTIPSGAGGSRFALSAHAGAAIPVDGFPSGVGIGLLLEADLEWRITRRFALEGVYGRYDFSSSPTLSGVTLYGKGYLPVGAAGTRLYGAAGPGLFRFSGGGGSELGLSVAAGVNHPVTGRVELDVGAGYGHVFASPAPDVGFVSLKAGLKVGF